MLDSIRQALVIALSGFALLVVVFTLLRQQLLSFRYATGWTADRSARVTARVDCFTARTPVRNDANWVVVGICEPPAPRNHAAADNCGLT